MLNFHDTSSAGKKVALVCRAGAAVCRCGSEFICPNVTGVTKVLVGLKSQVN